MYFRNTKLNMVIIGEKFLSRENCLVFMFGLISGKAVCASCEKGT